MDEENEGQDLAIDEKIQTEKDKKSALDAGIKFVIEEMDNVGSKQNNGPMGIQITRTGNGSYIGQLLGLNIFVATKDNDTKETKIHYDTKALEAVKEEVGDELYGEAGLPDPGYVREVQDIEEAKEHGDEGPGKAPDKEPDDGKDDKPKDDKEKPENEDENGKDAIEIGPEAIELDLDEYKITETETLRRFLNIDTKYQRVFLVPR